MSHVIAQAQCNEIESEKSSANRNVWRRRARINSKFHNYLHFEHIVARAVRRAPVMYGRRTQDLNRSELNWPAGSSGERFDSYFYVRSSNFTATVILFLSSCNYKALYYF